MIPGMKELSYEKRLELEQRRNRADLLEVFNMYNGRSTTLQF